MASLPLILGLTDDQLSMVMMSGMAVAVVAILASVVKGILRTRAREQTKREVAAYVAEGTISPEDAERILAADRPRRCP